VVLCMAEINELKSTVQHLMQKEQAKTL
jgi:hypothetical protein